MPAFRRAAFAAAILCAFVSPLHAQTREPAPFTGAYAGIEAGRSEHLFTLVLSDPRTPDGEAFEFRRSGVGGGAFAGYDIAPARWLRLGAEAGATIGGGTPMARLGDGDYRERPRYGLRLVGRAGIVPTERLMIYGLVGVGAQRVRALDGAGVADTADWASNIAYGAGAQLRLSRTLDARIEARRTPGISEQLMIGIPFRF